MTAFTDPKSHLSIPRDRWGKPLITPPDGGDPVPYARASSYGKVLESTYMLDRWQQRMVALGLAERQDLYLLAQSLSDQPADRTTLNRVCRDAIDAARGGAAANRGTAVHALTETVDRGELLPGGLPDDVLADLAAYRLATEPLTVHSIETFGVVDKYRVGGTWDRVVEWQGQHFVADLKTGRTLDYSAVSIAVQLALYAHATPYTPDGGRVPREVEVHQSAALIIHLPAGEGRCEIHWCDIRAGWELAGLASRVHAARERPFTRGLMQPFGGG